MIKYFCLAFLVVPTMAIACPKVAGHFECALKNQDADQELVQWLENDKYYFSDGTDDYIMDADEHDLDWGFFIGKYVGACTNTEVKLTVYGDVYLDEGILNIHDEVRYSMVDDNTLHFQRKYYRKNNDGSEYKSDDDINCKRVN